ncbi:antitoxin [bacterium]|jgi:hypothetical protein|nr:antitoxin [bacterium]
MRTTLDIDDDVLNLARSLARAQRVSVGRALSGLARKGLNSSLTEGLDEEEGIPVFRVSAQASPLTPEMVKEADLY